MLKYIPKYVRQDSDLEYGEVVTHENFNEKLNLNTTQGDYNTYVLEKLFNSEDPEDAYHIPYLDKTFQEHIDHMANYDERLNQLTQFLKLFENAYNDTANTVQAFKVGDLAVAKAVSADVLSGAADAVTNSYYGKNLDGNVGFFTFPDFVAAINPNETTAEISGIYFLPQANSVTESMLDESVRTKLNRSSVTDYLELSSKPIINGVELTGEKSLADLGIQPVGTYATQLYVDTTFYDVAETNAAINSAIANHATGYYTKTEVDNKISTSLSSYSTKAQTPVIQIGSTFSGTPKNGDILVTP